MPDLVSDLPTHAEGFYIWEATNRERGSCGVTGDVRRAGELLAEALDRLTPGSVGQYQLVRLDRVSRKAVYIKGPVLVRFRRTATAIVREAGE